MGINISDLGSNALELVVHGKLEKRDYEAFVPRAEARMAQSGKIGLLIHVTELQGATPGALVEDLKFDAKHYNHVSRIALVGPDDAKRFLAPLSKPFTAASVEYFHVDQLGTARAWVRGNVGDDLVTG